MFWSLRRGVPRILDQIYAQGSSALPIVLLVSVFVGLTTALQTNYQLGSAVPKYFVGMGVSRLVLMELAPVFTAFMVAGRSASGIAAELASMRVSQQIDALRVMGISPVKFLAVPRVVAVTLAVPVLVVVMDVLATLVAFGVAVLALHIPSESFTYGLTHFFRPRDFYVGLIKAVVFGLLIGVNGCYAGFRAAGGSEQVGQAATRAVVAATTMVLAVDFLIAVALVTS
jgi:phospholipid/cholesterol/gamma-HCH transport system permease protein